MQQVIAEVGHVVQTAVVSINIVSVKLIPRSAQTVEAITPPMIKPVLDINVNLKYLN